MVKKSVDGYIEDLKSDSSAVRADAAKALGKIGDVRAVEDLSKALKDTNEDVRVNAAESLGEIGDKSAIDALVGVLTDGTPMVRWCAAGALGEIGDRRTIDPLINALKDDVIHENVANALIKIIGRVEDAGTRRSIAKAIGKTGAKGAVVPLIRMLKDKDASVRFNAAWALGNIGNGEALWSLRRRLLSGSFGGEKDGSVRGMMRKAVEQIRVASAKEKIVEKEKEKLWTQIKPVRREGGKKKEKEFIVY
jgi:HEAT repeat protein